MNEKKNRDQMVLATKFSTCYRVGHDDEIIINTVGNGTKSLHLSVEASLKKLQTSYIDLLYVHWWDYTTSIPELMQSLNTLVQQGKVLYLGISDTPAWVVSKANEYARQKGLRQFSVYQGKWSAESRDFERDIIPMCAAGMCSFLVPRDRTVHNLPFLPPKSHSLLTSSKKVWDLHHGVLSAAATSRPKSSANRRKAASSARPAPRPLR